MHLSPALRETLTLARADCDPRADGFVITTASGAKHNASNLRRDVLAPAVEGANLRLDELGIASIGRCTFHGLRRTYASLRCALGDDLRYVSDQLGHTDVRFTLTVYAKATSRRERLTGAHLREYDKALDWARLGTGEPLVVPESVEAVAS